MPERASPVSIFMPNLLNQITARLQNLNDTPALNAQVLLAHITQKPRAWVLAHPELTLSSTQKEKLDQSLEELQNGIPLPYIIGHWEFFRLDFILTPDVLIPRPETEELVEHALKWLHDKGGVSVLDVGTGSGCILISLAKNAPDLNLLAVDISSSALDTAHQNAEKHGVSKQITFTQSDLFNNLQPSNLQTFNLITANLPYIPSQTLRGLDVYTREPTLALDGGTDGLDLIRRLLADAPPFLAPEGLILLEIASSHGKAALELAQEFFPEADNQLLKDLSGRDRFISIQT